MTAEIETARAVGKRETMIDTACLENGYVSAEGGKWHRATHPEPTFAHDEQTACGLAFRPQNVTWHGEMPPTSDHWMCKREGCVR